MTNQPPLPPEPRLLCIVGVTTALLMATQIALTRVLSVAVWYHFAFFAISVALLGTGFGALCVHLLQHRLARVPLMTVSAIAALVQGASTLLVALLVARVTPDWFGGMVAAFTLFTGKLSLVFASMLLPFFGGGVLLAAAISRHGAHAERVYFADLLGAGLGCLLVIPLLAGVGGLHALAVCGLLAGACAAACLWRRDPHVPARIHAGLRAASVLLACAALGLLASPLLSLRAAKGIDLALVRPELTRWNSYSLVSVFGETGFRGWGLSPRYTGPLPEQKNLVIDMNALTTLTRFSGDLRALPHLRHDLSALVYDVALKPDQVCVIGAGGGKDVLTALSAGSARVAAVEINPLIVEDVMRGAYRDFVGGLYDRPDVSVHVEDGRSFLQRSQQHFDVIVISMVDTSAATSAGAYALTENGLYTVEAFDAFLSRLAPEGVLSVSTVSLPGLWVGARLAALAREAMLRRGGDPAQTVAFARTHWVGRSDATLYEMLIKPSGFDTDELARFEAALDERAFTASFIPGRALAAAHAEDRILQRILTAKDGARLARELAALPLDVRAAHDDKPFFFYQNRFADLLAALGPNPVDHLFGNGLRVLAKVLALSGALWLLCMVLPLAWLRRGPAAAGGGGLRADLAYATCLGVGFMCIEIALVHRVTLYLGQPTYTLVAVLFVLLAFGGIGSRILGARLMQDPRRGGLVLCAIACAVVCLPLLTDGLFAISRGSSLPARAALVGCLLGPLALLLGAPLPGALARVAARDPTRVPWLFGVNAAASVLGSVVATLVTLQLGTQATLLLGAILYASAALWWWPAARAARMRA